MRTHCSQRDGSWTEISWIPGRWLFSFCLALVACGLAPRAVSAQQNSSVGAAEDPGSMTRSAAPIFLSSQQGRSSAANLERDQARRSAQRASRLKADAAQLNALCRRLQENVNVSVASELSASNQLPAQSARLAVEVERLAKRIHTEMTEP